MRHLGRERVICCFALDGVIVDPGPESSHRTLLEALGDDVPRATYSLRMSFCVVPWSAARSTPFSSATVM